MSHITTVGAVCRGPEDARPGGAEAVGAAS